MLLIGVAMAATACGSSTPQHVDTWAGRASRWLRNSDKALAIGIPNLAPFLSKDVVVDRRGTVQGRAVGRDAALALYRAMQATTHGSTVRGPAYLSTAGMVVLAHWRLPQRGGRQDATLSMSFVRDGLQREEAALSVRSGRWRSAAWPTGALPTDWRPLVALATRYVAAWSDGNRPAAAALYDRTVVVRDRLLRQQLIGRPAVMAATEHAAEQPATLRLDRLPQHRGVAVFGISLDLSQSFEKAVLLLTSDDGTGCPGHVAVSLALSPAGKVTHEERYHRIDDARRCIPPSARPHGWWEDLRVPQPVPLRRTGTLHVDGRDVEVWNGTPQLVGLVQWAIDRYTAAGLSPPVPASVTFYPAAPGECRGYAGLASGSRLTEITLCFGAEAACPDAGPCPPWAPPARQLVLHELAHTWMSAHLDDARQQEYCDAVHLPWWKVDAAWHERAVERAADTITWALDPDHPPLRAFGSPSDAQLTAEFRLLTGQDPP